MVCMVSFFFTKRGKGGYNWRVCGEKSIKKTKREKDKIKYRKKMGRRLSCSPSSIMLS